MGRQVTVRKRRAGVAAVTVAAVLVALKLWAMAATGALSVAASAADSAMDLLVSAGALAAVLYAARPPDADHAFGHSAAEDLAALGQALFLLAAAAAIGWAAAARLLAPAPPALAAEAQGVAVMMVSAALTAVLVVYQGRVARATGSPVIAADRLHYLGDLVPTLGAILSLAAAALLGLTRIDSVVALAASGMLAVGGIAVFRRAWDALMDRGADPGTVAGIAAIARCWPGIRGVHDLRTRRSGARLFVDMHVEIDGTLSLAEAHAIGAALKRAILAELPGADVIIHKDPWRQGAGADAGGAADAASAGSR